MVVQGFLSPQVKRTVIISNKLVYKSYLMSCRTTWDLRKLGNIGKISTPHIAFAQY